jgi:hypothetical protein
MKITTVFRRLKGAELCRLCRCTVCGRCAEDEDAAEDCRLSVKDRAFSLHWSARRSKEAACAVRAVGRRTLRG